MIMRSELNISLGDFTGFGFHINEIQPSHESTEFHKRYHDVGDSPKQNKRVYRNKGLL